MADPSKSDFLRRLMGSIENIFKLSLPVQDVPWIIKAKRVWEVLVDLMWHYPDKGTTQFDVDNLFLVTCVLNHLRYVATLEAPSQIVIQEANTSILRLAYYLDSFWYVVLLEEDTPNQGETVDVLRTRTSELIAQINTLEAALHLNHHHLDQDQAIQRPMVVTSHTHASDDQASASSSRATSRATTFVLHGIGSEYHFFSPTAYETHLAQESVTPGGQERFNSVSAEAGAMG